MNFTQKFLKLNPRTPIRFLGSFWVVILVDQLSKFIAQKYYFTLINKGISFSFFDTSGDIWLGVGPVFLLLLGWGILTARPLGAAAGLVLGGGLSNWVDRLMWGGVRDWLPLPLPGIELRNNIADWAITAGILILIYHEWQGKNERK
jgi:signal peptidase II